MIHQAQPAPDRALLLTLRERLDRTARLAAAPADNGWRRALSESLDQLRATLQRHFRRDEDERLNESFLEGFPRLEPQLRDLLSEHPLLMARLEALRSRAADVPRRDLPARCRLGSDVADFLLELERHEGAERDLILRAQTTDLGAGD